MTVKTYGNPANKYFIAFLFDYNGQIDSIKMYCRSRADIMFRIRRFIAARAIVHVQKHRYILRYCDDMIPYSTIKHYPMYGYRWLARRWCWLVIAAPPKDGCAAPKRHSYVIRPAGVKNFRQAPEWLYRHCRGVRHGNYNRLNDYKPGFAGTLIPIF